MDYFTHNHNHRPLLRSLRRPRRILQDYAIALLAGAIIGAVLALNI